MPLTEHPSGDYRFLPGIAPYSCGAVASPGFEVVHATFVNPEPYVRGFERIARHLEGEGRPLAALCGVELRSPRPYTFAGFAAFNAEYARILERWGVFVEGVNPVARTNVAPEVGAPGEPSVYGFSYTRPCAPGLPPTFVVAGAGELPEGVLEAPGIARRGDTTGAGIAAKAAFVMDLMEVRLTGLGAGWVDVGDINIYTIHPLGRLLPEVVLGRVGPAAIHGVHWYYSRPPVEEIEYEMDLRGVRAELRIA